jgi:pimeloyl-ACP methyl ester carboxylesterase
LTSETCTWIFLRGLARERGHWGDFVQQFQLAMPECNVIALDFPGNGYLNHLESLVDVSAMAEHCRGQLASLNVAPPYRLLAISLGGMVAVAWAQAHPQEVAALVLINTSMRPFNPFYERLRPANYWPLMKLMVLGGSPASWERAILRMTSNRTDGSVLPYWLALRRASPVSRANACRQLVAAGRFVAPLQKTDVPTLLIGSENDRLVSIKCSQAVARQWQHPLRLHPDAGHDLPLDDGPWLAEQVREWTQVRKGFIS